MKARLAKWGNSLAVRIPRAYADQLGFSEGSAVEFRAEGDSLVLRKEQHRLEELLAQVTADNLHDEADYGAPLGKEEW